MRKKGKFTKEVYVKIKEWFYIGKPGIVLDIRSAQGSRKLGECKITAGGIAWRPYRKWRKTLKKTSKKIYKLSWRDIENMELRKRGVY